MADLPSKLEYLSAKQPNVAAIIAPGKKPLSFSNLRAQLDCVRIALAETGIRRGDVVAVLMPKGPTLAVTCAVLPVSATCFVMETELSREDYTSLFQQASVRAILTSFDARHEGRIAARDAGIMQLEARTDPDAPAGVFTITPCDVPNVQTNAGRCGSDIAYIIGTSGTTAQRKLVQISHANILAHSAAERDWVGYNQNDVSLHLTPMHYSHGIKVGLMVPLLAGTSIVVAPDYEARTFFDLLHRYRPTWFAAGFTVFRDILRRAGSFSEVINSHQLRFMSIGSGKLEVDEIDALEAVFGVPALVRYSSTETGLISYHPLPPRRRERGSVGLPVANEVAVRSEGGHIQAPGNSGEIIVRGPTVFDGYLNDPEATKNAFMQDWYCTGDIGYLDDSGFLHLTGRIKDIINCGGVKIAPAEIETVLVSHPLIADAAAFSIPHGTLGEMVVAAIVPNKGVEVSKLEVRNYLLSRLTLAKTPRKLYYLDRIPRLANGKVQRNKLRSTVLPGAS